MAFVEMFGLAIPISIIAFLSIGFSVIFVTMNAYSAFVRRDKIMAGECWGFWTSSFVIVVAELVRSILLLEERSKNTTYFWLGMETCFIGVFIVVIAFSVVNRNFKPRNIFLFLATIVKVFFWIVMYTYALNFER
jgi:hypothetical protein